MDDIHFRKFFGNSKMASTLALFPQSTENGSVSESIDPADMSFGLTGHTGEIFSCDFSPNGMIFLFMSSM
jgi:hypothetical protein